MLNNRVARPVSPPVASPRQTSNPCRHPTCWASPQSSHTVFSKSCHEACISSPLSAHPSLVCGCTAPQIETPICVRRTTTYQFIWQQQHTCGTLGRSPMECGVDGQSHKIPYFNPRTQRPFTQSDPPRRAWVRCNRLCTGVGRILSCLHKWRMTSSAA